MRVRALLWCGLILAALCCLSSVASAATPSTTPGWECVPTTAGQAVVSGGTGTAPSCKTGTTAVLAPSYVSSGIGNKPTVQLSAVNLQVIDGAGATTKINGTGNIVIGYAENTGGAKRTGSHNLMLGSGNGRRGQQRLRCRRLGHRRRRERGLGRRRIDHGGNEQPGLRERRLDLGR
jgi:hypothetical protein